MTATNTTPAGVFPRDAMRAGARAQAAYEAVLHDDETLGAIVTWSVEGALIPARLLTRFAEDLHLATFRPLPIKPKTAMQRALQLLSGGNGHQLIRRVADNDEYALYVVVDEAETDGADGLPDLAFTTGLKLCWYKQLGQDPYTALAVSDETQAERLRALVVRYMNSYVAGDVSGMVLRALRDVRAISLRAGGGVYFVPRTEQGSERLVACRQLLTLVDEGAFGGHAYLSRFLVPDDEAHRNDMRLHVAADLRADIKKLTDDLKELEARAKAAKLTPNPRAGIAPATVAKYLGLVETLAGKADLYADLLQMTASDVRGRLGDLTARMQRLLVSDEVPF